MDFSHILKTAVPQKQKLIDYGFVQNEDGGKLILKKPVQQGGFYVLFTLTGDNFCADVYETETDEKYALFNVKNARGSFVGQLRTEVQNIAEEIRASGFDTTDLKQRYDDFFAGHYKIKPDFPWPDDLSDYYVFRKPSGKWFALIMRIKFKNLGFESEEPVWVVNLKADPEKIPVLVDGKSVFNAYHMNKKYWITVVLTAVTDFKKLCALTEESFSLVK